MSHFVPFVFPTLIHHCHFLWELSKNTPSRNIGKNNKIFFIARKYWALKTENKLWSNDPKKPRDTQIVGVFPSSELLNTCSRGLGGRPQPAINYNYHFRYQINNWPQCAPLSGDRALAVESAHLSWPKYAGNARHCEICPELYWLSAPGCCLLFSSYKHRLGPGKIETFIKQEVLGALCSKFHVCCSVVLGPSKDNKALL